MLAVGASRAAAAAPGADVDELHCAAISDGAHVAGRARTGEWLGSIDGKWDVPQHGCLGEHVAEEEAVVQVGKAQVLVADWDDTMDSLPRGQYRRVKVATDVVDSRVYDAPLLRSESEELSLAGFSSATMTSSSPRRKMPVCLPSSHRGRLQPSSLSVEGHCGSRDNDGGCGELVPAVPAL